MPTYTVTDPRSGKTVTLTGDSPPSEAELTEIFARVGASAGPSMSLAEGAMSPTQISDSAQPSKLAGAMDWLEHLAHPTSLGDFMGLLLPTQAGAQLAGEALTAYGSAAKRALSMSGSIRRFPLNLAKTLYEDAFPTAEQAAARRVSLPAGVVDRFMPNTSAAPQGVGQSADLERFRTVIKQLSPAQLTQLQKEAPHMADAVQEAITVDPSKIEVVNPGDEPFEHPIDAAHRAFYGK